VCKPKYIEKWKLLKEVPDDMKSLLPASTKKKGARGMGQLGWLGGGGWMERGWGCQGGAVGQQVQRGDAVFHVESAAQM